MLKRSKLGSQQRACCLKVKGALFVKSDIACGVNEIVAQILCQNDGVKIFAAACSVVTACSVGKCVVSKFRFERKVNAQLGDDAVEALLDSGKLLVKAFTLYSQVIAAVEHIGDFDIAAEALSGSGSDNESSCGVCKNDVGNFLKLSCVGERASAELYNLSIHIRTPFRRLAAKKKYTHSKAPVHLPK